MIVIKLIPKTRQWLKLSTSFRCLCTNSFIGRNETIFRKPRNCIFLDILKQPKEQWNPISSIGLRFKSDGPKTSDNKGILIYEGALTRQIFLTKFFSLSSSALGFAMQPYLYHTFASAHVAVIVVLGSTVGFFTYVTPFLLHWVTKRYVANIYFNIMTTTFTLTTYTFFMRPRQTQFFASDAHIPDVPGLFTSMVIKGRPVFFDPKGFQDADAFEHLMGFDKPLDLKLYPDNKTGSAKRKES